MAETIEVRIDELGRVRVEFSGFAGDLCLEEAERLQKVLSGLGLEVSAGNLVMKSAGQIEGELGIEPTKGDGIRTGRDRQ